MKKKQLFANIEYSEMCDTNEGLVGPGSIERSAQLSLSQRYKAKVLVTIISVGNWSRTLVWGFVPVPEVAVAFYDRMA